MTIEETPLNDCLIIKDTVFKDDRGYFFESFNKRSFFIKTGIDVNFVQDNQSFSTKGVLRGLHYQKGNSAQAKLVRVIQGEVLDVVVDLRKESPTFGRYYSVVLSGNNSLQLYVPRGFAHGFVVLSDSVTFFYKCDNYYNKSEESGIRYNDTILNINWLLEEYDLIVSEKDRNLQTLNQFLDES